MTTAILKPRTLPPSYTHLCGGLATQLAPGDPYLVFDIPLPWSISYFDDLGRRCRDVEPGGEPEIVWRERYHCDRCDSLIELTEPLRLVRIPRKEH